MEKAATDAAVGTTAAKDAVDAKSAASPKPSGEHTESGGRAFSPTPGYRPNRMGELRAGFRNFRRTFGATWRIYRRSKEGIAGILILSSIIFVAVFAPFITPYTPAFTAPITDTYLADPKNIVLPAGEKSWNAPAGIVLQKEVGGGVNLTKILVYSKDGTAYFYPVSAGVQSRIVIGSPTVYYRPLIPTNVTYISSVSIGVNQMRILMVNDTALYVYSEEKDTGRLVLNEQVPLRFRPKFFSETWNGYRTGTMMCIAIANDTEVFLYSIIPSRDISSQKITPKSYRSNWILRNDTISAAPMLVYQPGYSRYPNGTMAVIPTEKSLRAYNITADFYVYPGINVTEMRSPRIGERLWNASYTVGGKSHTLLPSNSVTYPYPGADQLDFGKDRILVATREGDLLSYWRSNGTLEYEKRFLLRTTAYHYQLGGLFPSERAGAEGIPCIAYVGDGHEKTIMATLDVRNGTVANGTNQFIVLEGEVVSRPYYVPGLQYYLASTKEGNIYIIKETMKRWASFSVLGGAKTNTVFLGNIVEQRSIVGNYFGVITADGKLYVDSLTGRPIAPLPPGKYPSGNTYILGTDDAGHDIFTWLIYSARTEVVVGVLAALVATLMGTFIGVIAGYFGGKADIIVSGFVDVLLSLPGLVILLILASVLGPSLLTIVIIVGFLGWPGIARVVRSVILSLKSRAFIDSARVTGASSGRIIFRHLLPNVMPYAFYFMAISVSGAIVTEAALAFLGFGDPNSITWGMMLQFLRLSGHTLDAYWWLLPPGIMITLLSLSFYLIGRGFDEVLDPKLRRR